MTYSQRAAVITVIAMMPVCASAATPRQIAEVLPDAAPAEEFLPTSGGHQDLEPGWRAYQRGDIAEALKVYREASDASPKDASLWYDVGCLYALNHEFDNARDALAQALTLHPQLAAAHDALGQLDEQQGDLERAVASYLRARDLEPENTRILRHLARMQLRRKNAPAAREALEQLIRFEPSDAEARYQLGVVELRANEPDLAITEFRNALEHAPNHVMAWNGLGLAYARIGVFAEAMAALEKAKAIQPDSATTQTNFGVVAAAQEHWHDARDAWQRALEMSPDFAPAAQNLHALDALTTPSSQ